LIFVHSPLFAVRRYRGRGLERETGLCRRPSERGTAKLDL